MKLRYLMGFIAVCTSLIAADLDQYRLYVKEVDADSLALTNGLVCQVASGQEEKNPQIGDGVVFLPHFESKDGKKILNLLVKGNKVEKVQVSVDEESKKNCLTLVSSTISDDLKQLHIELSDGSKWILDEYIDSPIVKQFAKGDHVVIPATGHQLWLMNLDKTFENVNAFMPIKPAN